jgi:IS1 family transposase
VKNKPKYQIGDRIPQTKLVVRGIAPQKDGNYLYFVQIIESDNTFVGTQNDLTETIEIVNDKIRQKINRLMRSRE